MCISNIRPALLFCKHLLAHVTPSAFSAPMLKNILDFSLFLFAAIETCHHTSAVTLLQAPCKPYKMFVHTSALAPL